MTTNETSFFRDRPTFDLLHTDVLPDLIAKRAAERTIRIWSAACSSGQEPYSIVMTLDQHFPLLATWNVEILATDISNRMIERAKAGEYSQAEVNRGLPAKLLVRYFNQDGTTWLLKRRIRDRVTYSGHNLTNGTPPQVSWDIVFLRNVMIYFGTETKRAILRKIRRVLRPDGYLFLGGAETTLNVADGFERLSASCFRIRAESTSDRNTALSRAAAPTT